MVPVLTQAKRQVKTEITTKTTINKYDTTNYNKR